MVSYVSYKVARGEDGEVLILVVVDNGLVPPTGKELEKVLSLNPCCSGQWSRTGYL